MKIAGAKNRGIAADRSIYRRNSSTCSAYSPLSPHCVAIISCQNIMISLNKIVLKGDFKLLIFLLIAFHFNASKELHFE
jgi:hypothetical protein